MHPEAMAFAESAARTMLRGGLKWVVEFGSLDINGGVRVLLAPGAEHYTGIDMVAGPGVDVVCDAADWEPDGAYDIAASTEMFEHTPRWREVIAVAADALKPGGFFMISAACDPREPHTARHDTGLPEPDEYYCNINPDDLAQTLKDEGFTVEMIRTHPRGDVYCVAKLARS